MTRFVKPVFVLLATTAWVLPAHAASVFANQTTLTDLGLFSAGSYSISATGIVSLATIAGDGVFDVGPDGVPVTPILIPSYAYFNPNGSPIDIPGGNIFGPGGPTLNLGAVIGSLVAAPTTSDFFLIGNGTSISLGASGHIYALVNDTFYPNNNGSFTVNIAAIPEPASWALMIAGFGLVGAAARRRQSVRVTYA